MVAAKFSVTLELGDMTHVYQGPHSPLNAYGMQTKVAIYPLMLHATILLGSYDVNFVENEFWGGGIISSHAMIFGVNKYHALKL